MRRPPRPATTTWPFWLLIAAWVCATLPATTAFHVFVWAKGTAHFSHAERLREDVSALLSGHPRTPATGFTAATTTRSESPPVIQASSRPIDLIPASPPQRFIGSLHARPFPATAVLPPLTVVAEVPHPPPRGPVIA